MLPAAAEGWLGEEEAGKVGKAKFASSTHTLPMKGLALCFRRMDPACPWGRTILDFPQVVATHAMPTIASFVELLRL